MFDCSSRKRLGTSSATRIRNGMNEVTSLKLTEQIITDLLCCLNVFQRNPYAISSCSEWSRRQWHNGFLAFDIVHAVEFSRIGRAVIVTSRSVFRATALTYHQAGLCQFDTPETEVPGWHCLAGFSS